MVYFFLFLFLLFFILRYDLGKDTKNKRISYNFILIYIILLSGLSYRIGSDTIAYMEEYKDYLPIEDADFDYIFGYFRRQPGWMLLVSICKSIYPSFFFLKFVHSAIINIVFLNFFKQNCRLLFTSILFYIIISYLYFNCEILRESLAIAAFMYSYRYFKDSKWVKYYLCVLVGVMFHESALILIFVPLIKFIFPYARKYQGRFYLAFVLPLFVVAPLLSTSIQSLLTLEAFAEKGGHYLDQDNLNTSTFSLGLIKTYLLYLGFPLYIIYNKLKNNEEDGYLPLVLIYVAIYIVYIFIPIVYRTLNYFQLFYLLIYVDGFYDLARRYKNRQWRLYFTIFTACYLFIFVRLQFEEVGTTGVPRYKMYCPYTSVFEIGDYQRDPEREKLLNL